MMGRGLGPVVVGCLLMSAATANAKPDDAAVRAKCTKCKAITEMFKTKYAETDTIHFRGESKGWSLDNEKFLGRYKMGEARLAEIMEGLCSKSDDKCNALMEDLEEPLEEWWGLIDRNKLEGDISGLEEHLCINESKLCCREGRFGPECKGCLRPKADPTGAICNAHGHCDGDGTRGGTGKCKCNTGWGGKRCDKCKKAYYLAQSSDENAETECRKCDVACTNCTGPGPEGCLVCAKGFAEESEPERRCVDIDECLAVVETDEPVCSDRETWCKNTPGAFSCDKCHAGCKDPGGVTRRWCTGPDPENCTVCPDGYEESPEGGCVDIDECATPERCEADHYCVNLGGTHQCLRCDAKCSGKGCTGAGGAGCIECRTGYKRAPLAEGEAEGTAKDCLDVDECLDFPCDGASDCHNDDGSFSCKCASPNIEDPETGACTRPETLPPPKAPSAFTKEGVTAAMAELEALAKVTDADTATPTASGKTVVGESAGNLKLVNVSFDSAFSGTPDITYVQATNECCGDEFGYNAVDVTSEGFGLAVWRTDTQGGWGQGLEVEWGAVLRSADGGAGAKEDL